jgi:hypothetical protein
MASKAPDRGSGLRPHGSGGIPKRVSARQPPGIDQTFPKRRLDVAAAKDVSPGSVLVECKREAGGD